MSYVKTQWVNGDTITADKLNHIEAGIEANEAENSLVKSQLQAINTGTAQFDMGFVQGVRYATSPTRVSSSTTRCASQSAIHLRASDELEVIVPSGLKMGVVTTLGTDSGWKTSTFSVKPVADCDAYINAAKTSDAAVTPSDITGVVINYTDNSSRIIKLEQDSKDLADALPVITGNEPLDFDPNAWINTSGTTVTMSDGYPVYNVLTTSAYELSIVPCAKGDVFTLNVVGGIQARSYAIIDSEGNILDKGRENQTLTDFEIIMPEGAAFLILQDKKPTTRQSYKGRLLVKSYQNLFDDVYKYTGNQRLLNIYRLRYVNLAGTTISMDSDGFPVLTYANDVDVTIEPCTAGDVFTVSASGGIMKRAYGFVSSTGEVLEKSGEAVSLTDYVVVAPSNSAYFISHNMFGNTMPTGWKPNCYKGEYIQNSIEKHNYGFNKILAQIYANKVLGIAHRGLSSVAPENTTASFTEAARVGFVAIETDVRFTGDTDPVPVLIHDATVDRTSNGTGNVADMTLAQLKALDFGSWKGSQYAGEKILTLEEGLALCKKLGLIMVLENKTWVGATDATYRNKIVNAIKKYDYADNIFIIYDSAGALKNFGGSGGLGNIPLILLQSDIDENITDRVNDLKTVTNNVIVSIPYTVVTDAKAETLRSLGAKLHIWTVDTVADIIGMNAYVSGVTSNSLNAPVVLYNDAI